MYWEKICEGINYKTKISELWKKVKYLKGSNTNSKVIFTDPNGDFEEDKTIDNNFAQTFSLISKNAHSDTDNISSRNSTVNTFLNNYRSSSIYINLNTAITEDSLVLNESFRMKELEGVLNSVNKKSAPGYDNLTYQYLINLPENAKCYFLKLLNYSWEYNEIPELWKLAIVKPILKPNKNKKNYDSYRPISLTSSTSKIMEKIIGNRLSWYLEKNNLLRPSQAGFRKKMSTSDPIIRIEREANFAIKSGNYTVAILIDFTRAFDLLWVDGLLLKLIQLKIQGRIYNWIKNFLTNRKYIVKVGDSCSLPYTTENGTPQGSSISPILFIIMINDFPLLSKYTSEAFFADDCTIWRSGKNLEQIFYHLQQDLNLISEWCKKWGFTINTAKTQGIIFTNKTINKNKQLKLNIDQKPILFSNSVKLLGIHLDSKLTYKLQIDSIIEKSKSGINLMRAVSGSNWGGNKKTLLTIYKSFILSRLEYCSFIYLNCSKTLVGKLDTIQYKALLIAAGALIGTSRKAILSECGEIPLLLRREETLINYLLKIRNNSNNLSSSVLEDIKYQLESKSISKYNTTRKKARQRRAF